MIVFLAMSTWIRNGSATRGIRQVILRTPAFLHRTDYRFVGVDELYIKCRLRLSTRTYCLHQQQEGCKLSRNSFPVTLGSTTGDQVAPQRCSRDNPLEWEELYEMIVVKKDLAMLCRSPDIEEKYTQHRLECLQTYDSIYDYILHSKFNLSREWNSQSSRWRVPWDANESHIALVPNDFPYFIAPGIEHWVLWKLGGKVTDGELNQSISMLYIDHQIQDTIYWENPPHLKSLPDIDHFHILTKK